MNPSPPPLYFRSFQKHQWPSSSVYTESNCYKQPKRTPLFLRMIVLVFAMVCGLYIYSVCLKQFSVETSQLVPTRITTRIHYPKPQTFSRSECGHNLVRFFSILSMQRSGSGWFKTLSRGSSSNDGKPRRSRELASLFAETATAEMKKFKKNP
uniref:Uncharacterized protein n=1 Tax=Brassica oleracea var. oleracea TaxID=109376 RepID=A0A0D3AAX4_BRAOL